MLVGLSQFLLSFFLSLSFPFFLFTSVQYFFFSFCIAPFCISCEVFFVYILFGSLLSWWFDVCWCSFQRKKKKKQQQQQQKDISTVTYTELLKQVFSYYDFFFFRSFIALVGLRACGKTSRLRLLFATQYICLFSV